MKARQLHGKKKTLTINQLTYFIYHIKMNLNQDSDLKQTYQSRNKTVSSQREP